jgi:hypothetical protein
MAMALAAAVKVSLNGFATKLLGICCYLDARVVAAAAVNVEGVLAK